MTPSDSSLILRARKCAVPTTFDPDSPASAAIKAVAEGGANAALRSVFNDLLGRVEDTYQSIAYDPKSRYVALRVSELEALIKELAA